MQRILAVDDTPENLRRLNEILKSEYKLVVATSGKQAVRLLQESQEPPDLILLDIIMPELDGFELCQLIKGMKGFEGVPIIFISSLEHVDEKIQAFSSGGVDYITKPFEANELKVRISTHLTNRKMKVELEERNRDLDAAVREKTQELEDAYHRLEIVDQSKNEFLQLISHEFRTPANGVLGISELVFESDQPVSIDEELKQLFYTSRDRMLATLDDALMLADMHVSPDDFKTETVYLCELLRSIIGEMMEMFHERGISIKPADRCWTQIMGETKMLKIAFTSLFKTVAAFTEDGKQIEIAINESDGKVRVDIDAEGIGINPSRIEGFFDVFSPARLHTPAESLGLKPALARSILDLHSGAVTIDNNLEQNVRITVTLPLAQIGGGLPSASPINEPK